MSVTVAVVVSVAIVSFCAMFTVIAVFGIRHGHKYMEEGIKMKNNKEKS